MQFFRSDSRSRPVASIVVPAFGSPSLTRACLKSVHHFTDNYELVLVDNTGAMSELYEFADRVIVNGVNQGFAKGCNQGAGWSSARYVVFLNCDTEVSDGWLPALLEPFADHNVAATGARLVYPNGQVQHAGVRIGVVGGVLTAWNLTDDRVGVVDAVTGACMAVRHSVFAELGGFDTEYWCGYEDIDLCLRFRELGWGVRYCPRSNVMHHESASGPERWTAVQANVDLLQRKWLSKWVTHSML